MLFRSMDLYNSKVMAYIIVSICTLLEGLLIVFTIKLLLFHYWLHKTGITTYDYVIYKRNNPNANFDPKKVDTEHKSKVFDNIPDKSKIEISEYNKNCTTMNTIEPVANMGRIKKMYELN